MTKALPYHFKDLKPKRSKYGNKRVQFNGEWFDSILEKDRYVFLLDQQRCGLIKHLVRQPRFKLMAYYEHICDYVADYQYRITGPSDTIVVEDAKGGTATMTPVFRLKAKLFKAQMDYPIHIVTKQNLTSLPCP